MSTGRAREAHMGPCETVAAVRDELLCAPRAALGRVQSAHAHTLSSSGQTTALPRTPPPRNAGAPESELIGPGACAMPARARQPSPAPAWPALGAEGTGRGQVGRASVGSLRALRPGPCPAVGQPQMPTAHSDHLPRGGPVYGQSSQRCWVPRGREREVLASHPAPFLSPAPPAPRVSPVLGVEGICQAGEAGR